MNPRIKKLIGTIIILIWIPVYAVFILGLARLLLPHATWWAQLLFYSLAGTLWAVLPAAMFPWMMREPAPKA